MPTPAAAGDSEYRISMPAARGDLTDGELEGRKSAATAMPEECLNRFVRFVALGEWTGNAFGALAFLWATGVLLGGFCASLNHEDFWFATVMILIEAIRCAALQLALHLQSVNGSVAPGHQLPNTFRALSLVTSVHVTNCTAQTERSLRSFRISWISMNKILIFSIKKSHGFTRNCL